MKHLLHFPLRLSLLFLVLAAISLFLYTAIYEGAEGTVELDDFDQRYHAYIADSQIGPSFRLMEGSARFRVLSFLHLPDPISPHDYDPDERFHYGLRFHITESNGKPVETRDVWVATRTSRETGPDLSWSARATYYPLGSGPGEPTDPRLVEIDLSDLRAPGRLLRIESTPPDEFSPPSVNIVVFREFHRDQRTRDWQTRTMSPRRTEHLAARARIGEWSSPTSAEVEAMLLRGWRRETSITDIPARSLYISDFRLSSQVDAPHPAQNSPLAASYAVQGPARLEISHPAPTPRDLRVHLARTLSNSETPELRFSSEEITLPPLRNPLQPPSPVEAEQNCCIIIDVSEDESLSLQVEVLGDPPLEPLMWIDRPEAMAGTPPIHEREAHRFLVGPEFRRFSVWEAREKGAEKVRFTLRRNSFELGDALLLNLRHPAANPLTPSEKDEPLPSELHFRFTGPHIEPLEGSIPMEGRPSRFELVTAPAVTMGGAMRSPEPERADAVTESASHRFWIPQGAETLELWTSQGPAWITLQVLDLENPADLLRPPPFDWSPPGFRWRYAPLDSGSWLTLGPDNAPSLSVSNRQRQIRAQVRWEPPWQEFWAQQFLNHQDEGALQELASYWNAEFQPEILHAGRRESLQARTLQPEGSLFGSLLLESFAGASISERLEAIQNWDQTWRSELVRGRPFHCSLSHGDQISIEYRLGEDALGATLEIRSEEELLRTQRIMVPAGRILLPITEPLITLNLTLVDDAGNQFPRRSSEAWWTGCRVSPDSRAPLWRQRRVYPLESRRPLTLRAASSTREQRFLNVVAYLESPSATVRTIVADGSPPGLATGRVQQITAPQRTEELVAPSRDALFPGPEGRSLYGPVHFSIPLGSDWEPRTYPIRLELDGPGRIWVRFFMLE